MNSEVLLVNYTNPQHAIDLVHLMDSYARDPMGGNTPLTSMVKASLASALAKLPHAFSVICYVNGKPVGLVNCFEAFSTFKCQPLINIHDVIVIEGFRGQKISHLMLQKVEQVAREKACCKITLEVLEGNVIARNSYTKFGFKSYELDPKMGQAMFWQKDL
jgi:GNAT superfamily N-acetyltransferase